MIDLPIKRLLFEISSNRPLPFKHNFPTVTLRGAFGYSLLQVVSRDEAKNDIEKVNICKHLFFPNGISDKSTHLNCARPFVIRGDYSRPDRKAFIMEMVLFGDAIEYEELVDEVIINMCKMGLGNNGNVCNCKKLISESITPATYKFSKGACLINFKTPTRIKVKKSYLEDCISFQHLFTHLGNRLKELVNVYTESTLENEELAILKEESSKIGSIVNEATFCPITRTSSRTGDTYTMGGFVGEILYTGNLKQFSEILSYLPWLNVGSSTAFGCGWCSIHDIM